MITATGTKIKVLVVDDSAIVRKILREQLAMDPAINIVATAPDAYIAYDKIIKLDPDVIILDVEMPRMDGITFLRGLMKSHPMPVIVLSSLTKKSSDKAIEALESGAIEVMHKPGQSHTVSEVCTTLIEKIKVASKAHIKNKSERVEFSATKRLDMAETTTNKILAIGASTGGVEALRQILPAMPANAPATLVVQHMPSTFTTSFAERLNDICAMEVKEAENGDSVIPGRVLIAPGGWHMVLQQHDGIYSVAIKDGPLVCHQRPSVEVLFDSVAKCAGHNAVGAILSGMGRDGACGLLKMRQSGAHTIAQNESSCVVFGMPKEAIACGAAEKVVPLSDVAKTIIKLVQS